MTFSWMTPFFLDFSNHFALIGSHSNFSAKYSTYSFERQWNWQAQDCMIFAIGLPYNWLYFL